MTYPCGTYYRGCYVPQTQSYSQPSSGKLYNYTKKINENGQLVIEFEVDQNESNLKLHYGKEGSALYLHPYINNLSSNVTSQKWNYEGVDFKTEKQKNGRQKFTITASHVKYGQWFAVGINNKWEKSVQAHDARYVDPNDPGPSGDIKSKTAMETLEGRIEKTKATLASRLIGPNSRILGAEKEIKESQAQLNNTSKIFSPLEIGALQNKLMLHKVRLETALSVKKKILDAQAKIDKAVAQLKSNEITIEEVNKILAEIDSTSYVISEEELKKLNDVVRTTEKNFNERENVYENIKRVLEVLRELNEEAAGMVGAGKGGPFAKFGIGILGNITEYGGNIWYGETTEEAYRKLVDKLKEDGLEFIVDLAAKRAGDIAENRTKNAGTKIAGSLEKSGFKGAAEIVGEVTDPFSKIVRSVTEEITRKKITDKSSILQPKEAPKKDQDLRK